ncbi:MAG: aminotransferase class III-fold pyridoxal phosphate-dependent enzyme [Pseudomonadota bacterium]
MESAGFTLEERFLIPSYAKLPISIERGEGVHVWDGEGRKYLDLYGGHAVALLGHSPPELVRVLAEQASKLMFYSSVAYSSVRAKAAEDLVSFTGRDMQVFFSNSGSEANENALKIARIATGRAGVVSFEGSFHGRTAGSIAVTGVEKYRRENSPHVRFARFGDIEDLRKNLNESIGAVIFEPIQSLSGVKGASRDYFAAAFEVCHEAGALTIFDEIQTGLGRCGSPMYFHKLGVDPDVVSLAKGLAGGFPVGATLARRAIARKIKHGDLGSTFGAGPLACALISATLSIVRDRELSQAADARGGELRSLLAGMPGAMEVRGEGLLIGIKTRKAASELVKTFLSRGILIGSSLDPEVIRLLPPLTVKKEDLEQFSRTLKEVL